MSKLTFYGALILCACLVSLLGCSGPTPEQLVEQAKKSLAEQGGARTAVIQLKGALQQNQNFAEARMVLAAALLDLGDVRGAEIELEKAENLGVVADRIAPILAKLMLAKGEHEKLITQFAGRELNAPEDDSDLYATLSTTYALQGDTVKARESIDKSVASNPANSRAHIIRVRLLAGVDGFPAALNAINELLEKYPNTIDGWILKGNILVALTKPDEAIKAFNSALALNKNNIHAHEGIIIQLILKKDMDGAQKQLDKLVAVNPSHPQTRMLAAMLALDRNELKVAGENIDALLKIAPEDVRVLYLAGAVEFRRGAYLRAQSHLSKGLSLAPSFTKSRLLLARSYSRAGDPGKALEALQPMLIEPLASGEAASVAAESYLQMNDVKRAEELYTKAAALIPNDVRSRTSLALVQVSSGKQEKGFATLRSIAAEDSSPVADMALVSAYLQKDDAVQALLAIDALGKKTPQQPTAANLRGRVELLQGNKEKARAAFEAAVKIDPLFFPAAEALAQLDLEAKQIDAAAGRFKGILEADPKNVKAHMAVLAIRERGGATQAELAEQLNRLVKQMPNDAAPRLALIRLQLLRKESRAALAAAQEAAAALPNNADVLTALGAAQAAEGDVIQAGRSLNKVASMQPNSAEAHLRLAELYASQKDLAASQQSLKRALNIKADYLPAQTVLFAQLLRAGRLPEAIAIAKTVQTQRPGNSVGFGWRGDVEVVRKNWSEAGAAYNLGLSKEVSTELAIKFHHALLAVSKSKEAGQFAESWLKQFPTDAGFNRHLGEQALVGGDLAVAERQFMEVLRLQPGHAYAANNLAMILLQTKKPGAFGYAELANKSMPNHPQFLDTLAEVLAAEGQSEKALELQRRAVALEPNAAELRLHLARYLVAAGLKAEARRELQQLAALGDNFGPQAEVKKLLAGL